MSPNLTSRTISAMRLPLAIMVVFIHSFGFPEKYQVMNWQVLSSTDIYNIVQLFFSYGISLIAVPSFFLISGYLFFLKAEKFDWNFYKTQWRKRIFTLLIPYVIWNLYLPIKGIAAKIYRVFILGEPQNILTDYLSQVLTPAIFYNSSVCGNNLTTILGQTVESNTGPALLVFWFMRDLIIAVILAPILCFLLRKTKGWILTLLGALYLLRVQFFIPSQVIQAIFYFGIGAWFGINKTDYAPFLRNKILWLLLSLWIVLICLFLSLGGHFTSAGNNLCPAMVLVGVFAFTGLIAKCIQFNSIQFNSIQFNSIQSAKLLILPR